MPQALCKYAVLNHGSEKHHLFTATLLRLPPFCPKSGVAQTALGAHPVSPRHKQNAARYLFIQAFAIRAMLLEQLDQMRFPSRLGSFGAGVTCTTNSNGHHAS